MLCREIMQSFVQCVSADTTVAQAAARMRDDGIGLLPICDAAGKVVGTLTDRDIAVRVVAEKRSTHEPVERFMTRPAITCRSGDDLSVAQDLMSEMQVARIICLDEYGGFEGVLSLVDIAQSSQPAAATAALRDMSGREAGA